MRCNQEREGPVITLPPHAHIQKHLQDVCMHIEYTCHTMHMHIYTDMCLHTHTSHIYTYITHPHKHKHAQ